MTDIATFDQFLGQTIKVVAKPWKTTISGNEYNGTDYAIDLNDPSFKEIEALAHNNDLDLRITFPNSKQDSRYDHNRINLYVEPLEKEYYIVMFKKG